MNNQPPGGINPIYFGPPAQPIVHNVFNPNQLQYFNQGFPPRPPMQYFQQAPNIYGGGVSQMVPGLNLFPGGMVNNTASIYPNNFNTLPAMLPLQQHPTYNPQAPSVNYNSNTHYRLSQPYIGDPYRKPALLESKSSSGTSTPLEDDQPKPPKESPKTPPPLPSPHNNTAEDTTAERVETANITCKTENTSAEISLERNCPTSISTPTEYAQAGNSALKPIVLLDETIDETAHENTEEVYEDISSPEYPPFSPEYPPLSKTKTVHNEASSVSKRHTAYESELLFDSNHKERRTKHHHHRTDKRVHTLKTTSEHTRTKSQSSAKDNQYAKRRREIEEINEMIHKVRHEEVRTNKPCPHEEVRTNKPWPHEEVRTNKPWPHEEVRTNKSWPHSPSKKVKLNNEDSTSHHDLPKVKRTSSTGEQNDGNIFIETSHLPKVKAISSSGEKNDHKIETSQPDFLTATTTTISGDTENNNKLVDTSSSLQQTSHHQHHHKKKKRRRSSKDKKRRWDVKDVTEVKEAPSDVKKDYYSKSESLENAVEAKPILIKLQERFEAFCKTLNCKKERSTVDEAIAYNPVTTDLDKCNCSIQLKSRGVHHNVYPSQKFIEPCKKLTNNADKLLHYKISIDPLQNFTTKRPTVVYYNGKEFNFDGFSVFSHALLDEFPVYVFQRNGFEYTLCLEKVADIPQNFCIKDLDLIEEFWFSDLFELNDWQFDDKRGCPLLHFMPRFICKTLDKNSEYLPMAQLLLYHLESYTLFYDANDLSKDWKEFEQINKGSIVCNPNKKPRALRVDDFREQINKEPPQFIHLASIPEIAQVSLKDLKIVSDEITKLTKAVNSRAIPSIKEKERLYKMQQKLDSMTVKRNATKCQDVKIQMDGYYTTGLRWDVFQHTSYLHGFWKHCKFVSCLYDLEDKIKYTFKDKSLLKKAVTLPSYLDQSSMDYCTNVSVHNIGKKKPQVNSQKLGHVGPRRKGVMSMAHAMTTLHDGKKNKKSKSPHNERLEFLGDALLDYLTSLHLFLMFPDKDAGKLTQFRTDIVQTENLAQVAKTINLEDFLLMSHHSGIQQDKKILQHYQANVLEAVIGAVYLDGGLNACDKLLCNLLFADDKELTFIWKSNKQHPLQKMNPDGDRHLIPKNKLLQKMCNLEQVIGVEFKNIRLLARAFVRNVAGLEDVKLTGGDYNRLEFLGDAILKYVCSDHLYKTFPDHQEGHLTLLRISMINAKCLTSAAKDLGLDEYIVFESQRKAQTAKSKVYSDVFESLLGAVHIDRNPKGIKYCQKIIEVSILSRLDDLIKNQDWIDPKSQLQQCCLSLRGVDSPDDHPVYKKHEESSATQEFTVTVYFRGKRLGTGAARTVKDAEKEAAKDALASNHFEQHARQKRLIYRKFGPVRKDGSGCSEEANFLDNNGL